MLLSKKDTSAYATATPQEKQLATRLDFCWRDEHHRLAKCHRHNRSTTTKYHKSKDNNYHYITPHYATSQPYYYRCYFVDTTWLPLPTWRRHHRLLSKCNDRPKTTQVPQPSTTSLAKPTKSKPLPLRHHPMSSHHANPHNKPTTAHATTLSTPFP